MSRTKVIIGEKYWNLTPIEVIGRNKHGLLIYKCLCDCGKTTNVGSRYLTEGRIKSCGCRKAKSYSLSKSPTYKSWISAKQRCVNAHNHNYKNYGGRGITMCDRWINSFANFLFDMGERPSKDYTLDRIDCNGNYEKSNCRWSDKKTQANNRRNNHLLKYKGSILTVSIFVEQHGLNMSNVVFDIRNGLSPEEIIRKYNQEQRNTKGGYGSTGK